MPLGPRITNTVPRMSQQAAPFVNRAFQEVFGAAAQSGLEKPSQLQNGRDCTCSLGLLPPATEHGYGQYFMYGSFSRDTTVFSQVNLLKICTEKPTAIHALPWSWRLGSSAFWIVGARVQRSVKNHSGVQRSRSVSSYEEIDRINNFGMISLTKHHLWWGQI